MNKQREVIYGLRKQVLSREGVPEGIHESIEELSENLVDSIADSKTFPEEWDYRRLSESVMRLFAFVPEVRSEETGGMTREKLLEKVLTRALEVYRKKEAEFGAETLRYLEQVIYLQTIDTLWEEHLLAMDYLKEGIGLRATGSAIPSRNTRRKGTRCSASSSPASRKRPSRSSPGSRSPGPKR